MLELYAAHGCVPLVETSTRNDAELQETRDLLTAAATSKPGAAAGVTACAGGSGVAGAVASSDLTQGPATPLSNAYGTRQPAVHGARHEGGRSAGHMRGNAQASAGVAAVATKSTGTKRVAYGLPDAVGAVRMRGRHAL
jgi:hypothetical protein